MDHKCVYDGLNSHSDGYHFAHSWAASALGHLPACFAVSCIYSSTSLGHSFSVLMLLLAPPPTQQLFILVSFLLRIQEHIFTIPDWFPGAVSPYLLCLGNPRILGVSQELWLTIMYLYVGTPCL